MIPSHVYHALYNAQSQRLEHASLYHHTGLHTSKKLQIIKLFGEYATYTFILYKTKNYTS